MTPRELFRNIMHYGPFDRMPVVHPGGWLETTDRWRTEGMPEDCDEHAFFHAQPPMGAPIPVYMDVYPHYEEKVVKETERYLYFQHGDGVVAQYVKGETGLPHRVDFLMKDRSGWPNYKARLQPHPDRIPDDLDEAIADARAKDLPISIETGSMVGWLRNWLGTETFCTTCLEDPVLIYEVADTVSDLVCWCLEQVLPKVQVDIAWGWEDICFRSGPLIPPDLFEQAVVPAYRKISDTLRKYGCDVYAVDSDGKIDALVPLWLKGGVNVMYPMEIGAWDADPMALRKEFGKDLRIMGGIDKFVLERGRKAIDDEIERRKPLMAEGGYIPSPDHLITPGTPLDNFRYFLYKMRRLRF